MTTNPVRKPKKEIVRREFLKLKLKGLSYKECKLQLEQEFELICAIRTLKYWFKRFNTTEWNLRDSSTRPLTTPPTVPLENEVRVVSLREETGWGSYKIKHHLERKGIKISESSIKRIVGRHSLSRGSAMKGKKLKWLRFQREHPNSMLQVDGDQDDDGQWVVPVIDDCSRYCLTIKKIKHNTTENMIRILEEAISMHCKPREILTDNGPEFGGNGKGDNDFDKWCEKQGIKHIRSGIHKPTTVGKVSKIQQTIDEELPYCNNDYEYFRYRYNHARPHMSLFGKTPAEVYFAFHMVF
jgi:putative transposase|tara:strand:- start:493 stop:1383 length:891 start_codon:yes stop_codon:yes gene_type:complete